MSESKETYDIVFSESEDEVDETRGVQEEVIFRLQENVHSIIRGFKDFLSTPSFINAKSDPTTNIVDLYAKKCYCIPNRKIRKLFKFAETMRRKKLKMMMYEKQSEYSGIMLDFDIKLKVGGVSPITHAHYHRLCLGVFRIILKYVHFPEQEHNTQKSFYVAFTKKPKVVFNPDGNYYKDGFHMIIPSIQIKREVKRLIIDDLSEMMDKIFKDITPHETQTRKDFIDTNSAHVGVFFIGSSTKVNAPPYLMDSIYRVQMTIGGDSDDIIPIRDNKFMEPEKNANICHEFSLNWAKSSEKGGIVAKKRYDIVAKYSALLHQYNTKNNNYDEFEEDDDQHYNELSILGMHDPDSGYIKALLDILHPSRAEKYELWFDVLCALAHTSSSYKPLGEYFSRKAPASFDMTTFESTWESILSKKGNSLSLGSLHFWAKMDNPDRYEEVRHRSIFNLLYKKIYNPTVEGCLEHYDIAEILFNVLKDKYVFDRYDAQGGTWYEFILENEPMRDGELYKWRKSKSRAPNSMMIYMSTVLPVLFRKILDRIKAALDESSENLAKYHYQIYKNFQKSCRCLKNSGFKRSVATECEQLFERIGFSELLDADPNINGVANGLMMLGKKCKLVTGFHGHYISKYTNVRFKYFNPHDPITKKVLISLRNLFPDDEPDSFDYIMHYLASTLDGHKKESIMLLLVGKGSNGKSFLVELHKGAIGSTYGVKMPLSFLTSRSKDAESATPALMQLMHAHFAYYSESNKFEVLNMAKIKEFTGQETLGGRRLHQDYVNFKPKCHHLVASNFPFEITSSDHGTWRRLVYVEMAIKFCNLATDKYDPTNPLERIADPSLGSKSTEDPEILSSYLSILSYYYESLHKNYNGIVNSVPHPHIVQQTEAFRNKQDRTNNFLDITLVKTSDPDYEMPITAIRDRYIRWHENLYTGGTKDYQRGIIDQLENSKIQKHLRKDRKGCFLIGYRILELGEEKKEDEEFYVDLFEKKNNKRVKTIHESAAELHARLVKEYDDKSNTDDNSRRGESSPYAPINIQQLESDDSDSDIDAIIQSVEARRPTKKMAKQYRQNNIPDKEIDSTGLPKYKSKKKRTKEELANCAEFANMGNESNSDSGDDNSDSSDNDGDDDNSDSSNSDDNPDEDSDDSDASN